MIFAEPFQKAYKSCVNFQNVRTDSSRLLLKFKCSTFYRICKHSKGMMFPFFHLVIQHHHWFLRCCFSFTGIKNRVCALRCFFVIRSIVKIKYWHSALLLYLCKYLYFFPYVLPFFYAYPCIIITYLSECVYPAL